VRCAAQCTRFPDGLLHLGSMRRDNGQLLGAGRLQPMQEIRRYRAASRSPQCRAGS